MCPRLAAVERRRRRRRRRLDGSADVGCPLPPPRSPAHPVVDQPSYGSYFAQLSEVELQGESKSGWHVIPQGRSELPGTSITACLTGRSTSRVFTLLMVSRSRLPLARRLPFCLPILLPPRHAWSWQGGAGACKSTQFKQGSSEHFFQLTWTPN